MSVFKLAFADWTCGVAADYGPRGDVLEDGGTGADNGTVVEGDAHADEGFGSHPYAVADDDVTANE